MIDTITEGQAILILTRCRNETIVVGDGITITVVAIEKGRVRLGIEAPKAVRVDRSEIRDAKDQDEADEAYRQWWTKGGAK